MRTRCRRAFVAAVLVIGLCLLAGTARADGDPASDVLSSQWLFLPSDVPAAPFELAALEQLIREARAEGLPVKVALVGSEYDLGSVTALWMQPKLYARFLGTELAYVFHGRVLVVMPNGIGAARAGEASRGDEAALAGLDARAGLLQAAIAAVYRLAHAAGVSLPAPTGTGPTRAVTRASPTRWGSLAALAVGGLVIVSAWAYSLRRRPLRSGRSSVHRGGKT